MQKQKKFLIFGFGNISQRHFRNLKKLQSDCKINVYTNKYKKHRIFDYSLSLSFSNNLFEFYNINNIFYNIEEALNAENYDAIFLCSLPPDRIDIAIETVKRGFNLFIEKPLSNNLVGVYKLKEIIENKKLNCSVGFQMRFHPIIQDIKQMLDNKEFGEIYRIEVNHCNSIYNWTKGRKDLKDFYALKKINGGGVINSQSHEIDYLNYLFGKHYPISAIYGNKLGYEVEDFITILSNLEIEGNCIPIVINLDFISSIPKREISIYGTKKAQSFNLLPSDSVDWNNLFIQEMEAFLGLLDGKKDSRLATLEDGISSLEYVMGIKDNFIKI